MKSLADIINEWKEFNIPLEDGCSFPFEKECEFKEREDNPMECKIIVTLRDKYTHFGGVFQNKAFVAIYLTANQNNSDKTLKAIENRMFELFLQKFTEDSVNVRRREIQELRMIGQVTFQELR